MRNEQNEWTGWMDGADEYPLDYYTIMSTRAHAVQNSLYWPGQLSVKNLKRSVESLIQLTFWDYHSKKKQGRGITSVYLALLANRVGSAGKDWKKQMFTTHLF